MLNLDLDNLPRAVRAMKCEALAGELAKLHVAIMNSADEPTRKALNLTANAIEKSIEIAVGTPEQRALEDAESQLEAGIREHLIHLSLLRLSPLNHREQSQVEGELEVLRRRVVALRPTASPYTSDSDEKVKQLRELVGTVCCSELGTGGCRCWEYDVMPSSKMGTDGEMPQSKAYILWETKLLPLVKKMEEVCRILGGEP